jgi:uncharacterized protein YdcH (DUF465 family)
MPIEPHDLHREFPEYAELIHKLKESDKHFRRLFDQYHEIDHEVHRVEKSGISSDEYAETCKKKRLLLKDQLFEILKAHA